MSFPRVIATSVGKSTFSFQNYELVATYIDGEITHIFSFSCRDRVRYLHLFIGELNACIF